jgi:hypothetical protein
VRPATSCPQEANKRQRTCHRHLQLPILLPPSELPRTVTPVKFINSFQMLLAIGPQTSQGHVTDHTNHAVRGLQFKTVVHGMWSRVL